MIKINKTVLSGWALCCIGIMLPWLKMPISGIFRSFHIPITNAPLWWNNSKFHLLSYGIICLIITTSALGAYFIRKYKIAFILTTVYLLIVFFFVLHAGVKDQQLIEELIDQNRYYESIVDFNTQFSRENSYSIPFYLKAYIPQNLEGYTILNRLRILFHFYPTGWYISLIGGVLIAVGIGVNKIRGGKIYIYLSLFSIFSFIIIILLPYLISNYHLFVADNWRAQGLHNLAIAKYDLAEKWNTALIYNNQFHINRGEAYYHLNNYENGEANYYLSHQLANNSKWKEAIEQLNLALVNDPSSLIFKKSLAQLYTRIGLNTYGMESKWIFSYRTPDMVHLAVEYWEKSLGFDKNQLHIHFYLAIAYSYVNENNKAINYNNYILSKSKNRYVKGCTYNNLGECYNKLGLVSEAKSMFLQSWNTYKDSNGRALVNLIGR